VTKLKINHAIKLRIYSLRLVPVAMDWGLAPPGKGRATTDLDAMAAARMNKIENLT
jgi:hypothetical protein